MSEHIRKKYKLSGLDCAVCAEKIRCEVEKLEGIEEASIDFLSQELCVKTRVHNETVLYESIEKAVKKLEPGVNIYDEAEVENKSNFKKDLVKIIISTVLFTLGIVLKFTAKLEDFTVSPEYLTMLAIFMISYLISGFDVIVSAFKNIIHGKVFDENFLMLVASVGAIAIGEYPEAVAVMILFSIGEMFQSMAVSKSRRSIRALMDIRPDYANLKDNGSERVVDPKKVAIGSVIIVKPGERIPIDGTVVSGSSSVNSSALTGESEPIYVGAGSEVFSGSVNLNGVIEIVTTKLFGDSTASRILQLVENSSAKKAETENFITRFAKIYTPVVVVAALLISFIIPLIFGLQFFEWVKRGLIFLVISCPCALVISVPLGYFSGIGKASSKGILIKGSGFLDALSRVSTVVFDKTGTLTKGNFSVIRIVTRNIETNELLKLAAYAENYSTHPISVSICEKYGKEIDTSQISDYHEIAGEGVTAVISGKKCLCGNLKLMKRYGIEGIEVDETNVQLAVDGKYAGYIVIADEVKKTSAIAVASLKRNGVKTIAMLTGDSEKKAKSVAKELSLDKYYAELMPVDKVMHVKDMEKALNPKEKLVFAGDGINDAPVLVEADIGIAMGAFGSDAAIEAADIVLMRDDPVQISEAISIAKKTRRIVIGNIVFALSVKLLIQVLGLFGIATMWEAVFADVGVCLIATLNSLRVLKR